MKNREIINRRLEKVDGMLTKLAYYMSRNEISREDYITVINEAKELIGEAKSFVEQEPLSPNEINNLGR